MGGRSGLSVAGYNRLFGVFLPRSDNPSPDCIVVYFCAVCSSNRKGGRSGLSVAGYNRLFGVFLPRSDNPSPDCIVVYFCAVCSSNRKWVEDLDYLWLDIIDCLECSFQDLTTQTVWSIPFKMRQLKGPTDSVLGQLTLYGEEEVQKTSARPEIFLQQNVLEGLQLTSQTSHHIHVYFQVLPTTPVVVIGLWHLHRPSTTTLFS
ncbi:hypothetical protein J6590_059220 [Homalodisca vitripennis]|nr:hypothetical protein J6590_059220 [Homalodisca vitripennis]